MIGKLQLEFGWKEIVSGMGQSNETGEAGMTPNSSHINPLVLAGAIYSSPNGTSMSTNVTGNMISSDVDSQAVLGYDRLYVDDEGGYYAQSGTSITKKQTGAQTSKYQLGRTDMASFNFNTYVTLKDNIAQFNSSGATSLDEDWWTTVAGGGQSALDNTAAHPLLVYERLTWVADGNQLHYFDESGNVTTDAILFPDNERIMALGIDPATGLMMISTSATLDFSNAKTSIFAVYLYDGFSAKPRRKILVDDLVTAFYAVGGILYVGMGTTIGQWNGSGVTFLRKLKNVVSQAPLWKSMFSNIENILLVCDGNELLGYGEIVAGRKSWFPLLKNRTADTSSTASYQVVAHYGTRFVAVGFASGDKIYSYNLRDASAGTGQLITSKIEFPRPVYIRRIRVFTTGITTTSGIGKAGFLDLSGTEISPAVSTLGKSGATTYYNDFDYTSYKTMDIQPFVTFASQAFAVTRFVIFYDIAE